MEVLKVLPQDAVDVNTQRCRMGPALMSGLGLRLGAPVLIRVQRGACLCTAWPRHDLAEGFLQISPQCVTPDLSAQTLAGLRVKHNHTPDLPQTLQRERQGVCAASGTQAEGFRAQRSQAARGSLCAPGSSGGPVRCGDGGQVCAG